jgi:hypothetical protein
MRVATRDLMRLRRFHELHLALAAQGVGIVIALAASLARTEPVAAAPALPAPAGYVAKPMAEPMATPDARTVPDAAAPPPDGALPPPDGAPPPIPPRVAPDAQPMPH